MDTYDFLADPRAITMQQRRATHARLHRDQSHWLTQLRRLTESGRVDDDFPAFLLATAPFHELAARLGNAPKRAALAPATADELDWFVDAFRDYLRTCDGEDVFQTAGSLSPWR